MLVRYVLHTFLFAFSLFIVNWFIVVSFKLFSDNWVVHFHSFFYILLLIVIIILYYTKRYYIGLVGYSFILMMLFKAIAIFLYLAIFHSKHGKQLNYIFNFSLVYLIYLFFSIYFGLQILSRNTSK